MGRQLWKPGNMLYPVPAVMVTCSEKADNRILLRSHGREQFAVLRRWFQYLLDRNAILMIL